MKASILSKALGWTFLKWLFAAAFVIALFFSGLLSGLMNKAGLFYLVSGSVAAALMGFSIREIGAAFRAAAGRPGTDAELLRAAHFWEAAARNAWVLGVLGSTLNVTTVLGGEAGGIGDVAGRMIQALLVTFYGLVLSAICLVPALKITGQIEKSGARETPAAEVREVSSSRPFVYERMIGYILFAAVLGLTVFFLLKGRPQNGTLPMAKIILHGPAILVIVGGTIAFALFVNGGARALTLGFAMTGLISLLLGFIQALFGFVHRSVQDIASALAFIISAGLFALLGMLAVGAPLEDREVMDGRGKRPDSLSRMFWIVFPILVFIFLVLTFIMVITPMKQHVG